MTMKMRGLILSVFFIVLMSGTALAAKQTFKLSNESGGTFVKVWVSPHGNEKFTSEDFIDLHLASGWNVDITPNLTGQRKNVRYWDLCVELDNGRQGKWFNFDLFSVSIIEIDKDLSANYR